jgi:hypothetical protein
LLTCIVLTGRTFARPVQHFRVPISRAGVVVVAALGDMDGLTGSVLPLRYCCMPGAVIHSIPPTFLRVQSTMRGSGRARPNAQMTKTTSNNAVTCILWPPIDRSIRYIYHFFDRGSAPIQDFLELLRLSRNQSIAIKHVSLHRLQTSHSYSFYYFSLESSLVKT